MNRTKVEFWYTVDGDAPEWLRIAGKTEDGKLILPYCAAGVSEQEVFLCASCDNQPAWEKHGHLYFLSDWLMENWPDARQVHDKVLESITRTDKELDG